jgi:hypothetical protein
MSRLPSPLRRLSFRSRLCLLCLVYSRCLRVDLLPSCLRLVGPSRLLLVQSLPSSFCGGWESGRCAARATILWRAGGMRRAHEKWRDGRRASISVQPPLQPTRAVPTSGAWCPGWADSPGASWSSQTRVYGEQQLLSDESPARLRRPPTAWQPRFSSPSPSFGRRAGRTRMMLLLCRRYWTRCRMALLMDSDDDK